MTLDEIDIRRDVVDRLVGLDIPYYVTGSIGKADFIVRESGPWANEAFERRLLLEDPLLGQVSVASLEDLVLAKLEWSDGDLDGLQGRDVRAIANGPSSLDEAYVRRHAITLGIDHVVEKVLGNG